MTIAIVRGVSFITLLIGYSIGASGKTDPRYPPCIACRHDCGHSHLIAENNNLRAQAQYLFAKLDQAERRQMCHRCFEPIIYAKTPTEQKVVDLIKKTSAPLDELKKELGI